MIGDVLPPFVRDEVTLSAEQLKKVEALEAEVKAKLSKILSPEQMKEFGSLLERGPGGPGGPGGPPEDDGPGRPERPRRPERP